MTVVVRPLVLAFVLLAPSAWVPRALAQGCAMCGSSFGANDPSIYAFKVSILFMMAVPYAILAVVGFWAYRAFRRRNGERPHAHVLRLPWERQRGAMKGNPT